MARKVILHIGRHKCGTTSIQRTLFWNREALCRLGFFYPQPPDSDFAHHRIGITLSDKRFGLPSSSVTRQNLSYILRGIDGTNPLKIAPEILVRVLRLVRSGRLFGIVPATTEVEAGEAPTGLAHKQRKLADKAELNDFRQTLLDAEQEWAVVSSEALQNCSPGKVRRFFRGFEVHPICYIREQGAYLRSSYAQRIQASYYGGSVEAYYHSSFHADYQKFLGKWSRVFGRRLVVRRFERAKLHEGDVVHDFLSRVLGLAGHDYQTFRLPEQENPSLSATMLAFKLRLNREGYRLAPKIYQLLVSLDPPGATPYRLPENFLSGVRDTYRHSNEAVARKFFPGEELFNIPGPTPSTPGLNLGMDLDEGKFQSLLLAFEQAAPGCITRAT